MERRIFKSKLHTGEWLKYVYHRPETPEKLPLVINIHDAWTPTYTDPKIWEWMFEQKRGSAEATSDTTEELKSIIKEG